MLVTHDLTYPRGYASAVALGFFDGVHMGHRAVIQAALTAAGEEDLVPCVFTFRPGETVPASKSGMTLLQTDGQKAAILDAMGVAEMAEPDFQSFCAMTPREFVEKVLRDILGARVIACGFNYHFGKGGSAGVPQLRELCEPMGIRVVALPPVLWRGEPVSSTRIRAAVREGRMEDARAMLGSPFTLDQPVVHGKSLARTLSWPTINQIFPPDFTIPRHGVYQSRVALEGKAWDGITNVGIKPTLHETNLTMETYILDYSGDLYGKNVPVSLLRFLRPEKKFDSVSELSARIQEDIRAVRAHSAR